MTTLKSLVDETSNIKDELVECHTNLKNNLIEKGVECNGDKIPTMINKIRDIKTGIFPKSLINEISVPFNGDTFKIIPILLGNKCHMLYAATPSSTIKNSCVVDLDTGEMLSYGNVITGVSTDIINSHQAKGDSISDTEYIYSLSRGTSLVYKANVSTSSYTRTNLPNANVLYGGCWHMINGELYGFGTSDYNSNVVKAYKYDINTQALTTLKSFNVTSGVSGSYSASGSDYNDTIYFYTSTDNVTDGVSYKGAILKYTISTNTIEEHVVSRYDIPKGCYLASNGNNLLHVTNDKLYLISGYQTSSSSSGYSSASKLVIFDLISKTWTAHNSYHVRYISSVSSYVTSSKKTLRFSRSSEASDALCTLIEINPQ